MTDATVAESARDTSGGATCTSPAVASPADTAHAGAARAAVAAPDASAAAREAAAWRVLEGVPDPEVPALSIVDLGIVRAVRAVPASGAALEVVLTPTYSGCPATEVIERSVAQALEEAGLGPVALRQQRAPAWTTDWISAEGRRKLHACGIAPPAGAAPSTDRAARGATVHVIARNVGCPRCGSAQTERLSVFGATACKSLYRCLACREPFEYFKPI